MRFIFFLPISLGFLFPIKNLVSRSSHVNAFCKCFPTGEIDAYNTLDALGLDVEDYSIGINNAAKIVCT